MNYTCDKISSPMTVKLYQKHSFYLLLRSPFDFRYRPVLFSLTILEWNKKLVFAALNENEKSCLFVCLHFASVDNRRLNFGTPAQFTLRAADTCRQMTWRHSTVQIKSGVNLLLTWTVFAIQFSCTPPANSNNRLNSWPVSEVTIFVWYPETDTTGVPKLDNPH